MNRFLIFLFSIISIWIRYAVSQNITAVDLPETHSHKSRRQSPVDFQEISLDCRNGMTVTIKFTGTFSGVIYSRDYYHDKKCRYVENESKETYTFSVPSNDECGTKPPCQLCNNVENIIIIQSDPQILSSNDLARKLSCPIPDDQKKDVFFKPIDINSLEVINVPSDEGDIQCWMNINEGIYPNIKPISRNINIGDPLSVVFYLNDPARKRQLQIKQCWAYDNIDFNDKSTQKKLLTNENGCPIVDSFGLWMKVTNANRDGATFIAHSTLKAFKFPGSSKVHIKCNIEFCTDNCLDKCSPVQNDYCEQNPSNIECQRKQITSQKTQKSLNLPYELTTKRIYSQNPSTKFQSISINDRNIDKSGEKIDCYTYPNSVGCKKYSYDNILKSTTAINNLYDCAINPYAPECFDCNKNPNGIGCRKSTQNQGYKYNVPKQINCETNPNHPNCLKISTKRPFDTVDCTKNPYDIRCTDNENSSPELLPSRKIISPIDCNKNPDTAGCFKPKKLTSAKATFIDCNRTPYAPECVKPTTRRPSYSTIGTKITSLPVKYSTTTKKNIDCDLNPFTPECQNLDNVDCSSNPNHSKCKGYVYNIPTPNVNCILYPNLRECVTITTQKAIVNEPTILKSNIDCDNNPNDPSCYKFVEDKPVYELTAEKDTSTYDCQLNPYTKECQGRIGVSYNCDLYPKSPGCRTIGVQGTSDCEQNPNAAGCNKLIRTNEIESLTKKEGCKRNPYDAECVRESSRSNICKTNPYAPECFEKTRFSTKKPVNPNSVSSQIDCEINSNAPGCSKYINNKVSTTQRPTGLKFSPKTSPKIFSSTPDCDNNPYAPECIRSSPVPENCRDNPDALGCLNTRFTTRKPFSTNTVISKIDCEINPSAPGCSKIGYNYNRPSSTQRPSYSLTTRTQFSPKTFLPQITTTLRTFKTNCDINPYAPECISPSPVPENCRDNPDALGCLNTRFTTRKPFSTNTVNPKIDCEINPSAPGCSFRQSTTQRPSYYPTTRTQFSAKTYLPPITSTPRTVKINCDNNPYAPECIRSSPVPENCRDNPDALGCLNTRFTTTKPFYTSTVIPKIDCEIKPSAPGCSFRQSSTQRPVNLLDCNIYPNAYGCARTTFLITSTAKVPTFNPATGTQFSAKTYLPPITSTPRTVKTNCDNNPYAPGCLRSSPVPENCRDNPDALGCLNTRFTTRKPFSKNTVIPKIDCEINPSAPGCSFRQSSTQRPSYYPTTRTQFSAKTYLPPITSTPRTVKTNCDNNPYAPECLRSSPVPENCRDNPDALGCLNTRFTTRKPFSKNTVIPKIDCEINPSAPGCSFRQSSTQRPSYYPTTRTQFSAKTYLPPITSTPRTVKTNCDNNPYAPECLRSSPVPENCRDNPDALGCLNTRFTTRRPFSKNTVIPKIDCEINPSAPGCSFRQSSTQRPSYYPTTRTQFSAKTYLPPITSTPRTVKTNCDNNPYAPECLRSSPVPENCRDNPDALGCLNTRFTTRRPFSKNTVIPKIDCEINPSAPGCSFRQSSTQRPSYYPTTRTQFSAKTYLPPITSTPRTVKTNCDNNPYAPECLRSSPVPENCRDNPDALECLNTRFTTRKPFSTNTVISKIDCEINPSAPGCSKIGYNYNRPSSTQRPSYSLTTRTQFSPKTFLPQITTAPRTFKTNCDNNPYAPECLRSSPVPENCRDNPDALGCLNTRFTTRKPFSTNTVIPKIDCEINPSAPGCSFRQSSTQRPSYYPTTRTQFSAKTYLPPITSTPRTVKTNCDNNPYAPECIRPSPVPENCRDNPDALGCLNTRFTTRKPFSTNTVISKIDCEINPSAPGCSFRQSSTQRPSYYPTTRTQFSAKTYLPPITSTPRTVKTNCDNNPYVPECIRPSPVPENCRDNPDALGCLNTRFTTRKPFSTNTVIPKIDCEINPSAPGCSFRQSSTQRPSYYPTTRTQFSAKTYLPPITSTPRTVKTNCDNNPYVPECIRPSPVPENCRDNPDALGCLNTRFTTRKPFYTNTVISKIDCEINPSAPGCSEIGYNYNRPSSTQRPSYSLTTRTQFFPKTYLPQITTTPRTFKTNCDINPYAPECIRPSPVPENCRDNPDALGCLNTRFTTTKPFYTSTVIPKIDCEINPSAPGCAKFSYNRPSSTQRPVNLLDCNIYPNAYGCARTTFVITSTAKVPTFNPATGTQFSPKTYLPPITSTPRTVKTNCDRNPYAPECLRSSPVPENCRDNPDALGCLNTRFTTRKPFSKNTVIPKIDCEINPSAPGCSFRQSSTQRPSYYPTTRTRFSAKTYLPPITSTPRTFKTNCDRNPYAPECIRPSPVPENCRDNPDALGCLNTRFTTRKPFYTNTVISKIDCEINPSAPGCSFRQSSTQRPSYYPTTRTQFSAKTYLPQITTTPRTFKINCDNNPYAPECLRSSPVPENCRDNPDALGCLNTRFTTRKPFSTNTVISKIDCEINPSAPGCSFRQSSTQRPSYYPTTRTQFSAKTYLPPITSTPRTFKTNCDNNPFAPECIRPSPVPENCRDNPDALGCLNTRFTTRKPFYTNTVIPKIDCEINPSAPGCDKFSYNSPSSTQRPVNLLDCNIYPNAYGCARTTFLITSTAKVPTFNPATGTRFSAKTYLPPITSTPRTVKTNCDRNPYAPECIRPSPVPENCRDNPDALGCLNTRFTTRKPFYTNTVISKIDCEINPSAPGCSKIGYNYNRPSSTQRPSYSLTTRTQFSPKTFLPQITTAPRTFKTNCDNNPYAPECLRSSPVPENCRDNPDALGCLNTRFTTRKPFSKNTVIPKIDCEINPSAPGCSFRQSSTQRPSYYPTTRTQFSAKTYLPPITSTPRTVKTNCDNNPYAPECLRPSPVPENCRDNPDALGCLNTRFTTTKPFYTSTVIPKIDCEINPSAPGCAKFSYNRPSSTQRPVNLLDCNIYPNAYGCARTTFLITSTAKVPTFNPATGTQFSAKTYLPPITSTPRTVKTNCDRNPYAPECLRSSPLPENCRDNPDALGCLNTRFTTRKPFSTNTVITKIDCEINPSAPGCAKFSYNSPSSTSRPANLLDCNIYPNAYGCARTTFVTDSSTKNPTGPIFSSAITSTLKPVKAQTTSRSKNCGLYPNAPGCRVASTLKSSVTTTPELSNCDLFPNSYECVKFSTSLRPINQNDCLRDPYALGCESFPLTTQSPRPFKTSSQLTDCALYPQSLGCRNSKYNFKVSTTPKPYLPTVTESGYSLNSSPIPYCSRFPNDKKCLSCYPGSPDPDCPQPFRPAVTKLPSTYLPPFK